MMRAKVVRARLRRMAGPAGFASALGLAAALGCGWVLADTERRALEGRVAELSAQLDQAQAHWRVSLASCVQPSAAADAVEAAGPPGRLSDPPAGLDVCARMESADAAVLNSLR